MLKLWWTFQFHSYQLDHSWVSICIQQNVLVPRRGRSFSRCFRATWWCQIPSYGSSILCTTCGLVDLVVVGNLSCSHRTPRKKQISWTFHRLGRSTMFRGAILFVTRPVISVKSLPHRLYRTWLHLE
jgi:hypothetical protein